MNSTPLKLTFHTKARIGLVLLAALLISSFLNFSLSDKPPARRLLQSQGEARRLLESQPVTSTLRQGKPIMATFFEPVAGGCCGMTEEGHTNLVKAWQRSWQLYGWETKILTEADARKHPRFDELTLKLEEANVNGYNQRCFWRWLAMSMDTDANGGWMSDYDFFPLRLTSVIGKELASVDGFKSWGRHIPTLIHADNKSWNLMTDLMIETVSKDLDIEFMSDMYMLEYLYNHHTEEELNIAAWEQMTYPGFPYRKDGEKIIVDCPAAMGRLGAHLSHVDTHKAVDNGLFPKVEGVIEGDLYSSMNARADAANIMMSHFKVACLKV